MKLEGRKAPSLSPSLYRKYFLCSSHQNNRMLAIYTIQLYVYVYVYVYVYASRYRLG